MNDILEYIDSEIEQFCKNNPNYIFFRVGSSLFNNEIPCNDIDYLIYDIESSIDRTSQIDNFQKQFSESNFSNSTIQTYDNKIDKFFIRIESDITAKFQIQIIHVFGFGPIPTLENTITLHLAGPMNKKSAKYFFDIYPIFLMGFFKFNKSLSAARFENLFTAPDYSQFDLTRIIHTNV